MVKSFAVLLTAALALVAGACAQTPPTPQPTPIAKPAVGVPVQPLNPPVKLKVGVIGLSPEVGLYLAVDKGYMREEGLEVELVTPSMPVVRPASCTSSGSWRWADSRSAIST